MAKRKPRAPDYSDFVRWVDTTVELWKARQERFEEEQDLIELHRPAQRRSSGPEDTLGDNPFAGGDQPGTEPFVSANARILVEKVTRLIGSARAAIEYVGNHPDASETHQVIENMLRWMRREWARRWRQGLHHPLQYEVAAQAATRGWIVSRLLLNNDPDDELPVLRSLHDPATVFPYEVNNRVVRVVHQYRATVSDLLDGDVYPDGEEWLSTITDGEFEIEVSSVYVERDGTVWHAVIGLPGRYNDGRKRSTNDGGWLKKPVQLGYMPWVITLAQGAPYRETAWSGTGEYVEWLGTSAITTLVKNYRARDKILTMLMTVLANSANPPKSVYSADPQGAAAQISEGFGAGDTVVLAQGDKLEFHRIGPNPGDFQAMFDTIKDIEYMGSIPPSLWGDPSGVSNGQQLAIVNHSARDFLNPFVDAVVAHEEECLRRALEIIRDHWPRNMSVFVSAAANRPANMYELDPTVLRDEGVAGVSFSLEDITPQDFAMLAQVWTMLVKEHLASMKRARGREGLKFDDPELEDMEVMGDLIKSDEQMVKFMIPFALLMTGQKMVGGLYDVLHGPDLDAQLRAVIEQALSNAMGVPAQTPSPPQQPTAGPMLGGEVLPPVAQTGFTPGQFDTMTPMNTGLVMGGAGAGGIPPVGGEPALGDQLMLPLGGV